jgi:ABC-type sugar transport system ATPase subunit
MSGPPLLEARRISKSFPGVQALVDVDFTVAAGEIHALVGENGAGKSTLVKILTGVYQPDAGTLLVDGREARIATRRDAERLGISAIHQEIVLVPELDVASNILLGEPPTLGRGWRGRLGVIDRSQLYAQAKAALARVHADIDPRLRAGSLGVSAAQLVLIARGLSQDNRILILDEPTAALTPGERDELFVKLYALRDRGVGILYVSHRLDEVITLASRVTVMRDGRVIQTLPAAEAKVERVIELMLARSLSEMYPQRHQLDRRPVVFEVQGLSCAGTIHNVNLNVKGGEIVGVTGLVGAGKSELARAIYGADARDAGTILVDGIETPIRSPRDALKAGISLVPEDRKSQGLVLLLSIVENIALAVANCVRVSGAVTRFNQVLASRRLSAIAKSYVKRFSIHARSEYQLTRDLSGGTQQKVVLAKNLATKPKVIIFDEPTRGIDVGSKAEIYRMMEDLAEGGTAILLVSSEVQEVVEMSDRIYVMRKGAVVAEVNRAEASERIVMRYAAAGG